MTKTEKNLIPMVLLASGSFGSAADATIITQNFTYPGSFLDITATGAATVMVADADTKYSISYVRSQSNGGGGKKNQPTYSTNYYFNTISSDALYSGGFTSYSAIGTADEDYTWKTSGPLTTNYMTYTQLKFGLAGVTTYGVVGVKDGLFKTISYDVRDPVAPVPEPDVWAEMIVGLGAAGAVMRKRRRSARAIAV